MRYLTLLLVVALLGGWHWWTRERAVSHAPGVLVSAEPGLPAAGAAYHDTAIWIRKEPANAAPA